MTNSHEKIKLPLGRMVARTALTLVIMGGAVASGVAAYGTLSARAAQTVDQGVAPPTVVRPIAIKMQTDMTVGRRFAGQFEAPQETVLSFEEPGTVSEVYVREGDVVSRGMVIARLDDRLLMAEQDRLHASRDAIAAQVELAKRTNQRQQRLLETGHVSAQRVDETSLRLAQLTATALELEAALDAVAVRLSKTVLRAPFDGMVGQRAADAGVVAAPSAQIVTVLQTGTARFRVSVDPDLAQKMTMGDSAHIVSGARSYPAVLAHLAPELDPVTRAQFAFFDVLSNDVPPSRAAGEVTITQTIPAVGAWVPLSALQQGLQGTWSVLTVSGAAQPVVGRELVEIIQIESDRAYVRGSFTDGALIIPAGTHRVVPGEPVQIAAERF
ncbi:efflux RND transporter periplasmic adaptor subunit [Phaeobacter sp.]|uniref:efflux RND transporter periplasmic adaptor subunit n=1 Tax=Phaeobacter sp. TaxID=1902409 RepID=UPI0026002DA0|nr:efflux RND transporter periplasmic adaptor subunit [Phaeobacter sp.]